MKIFDKKSIRGDSSGYTIVMVIGIMVITLILIEGIVLWLQNESKWAVKYKRSTSAFHLAEAGIDRGVWTLKKSTGTWNKAATGVVVSGYDFDETYEDIPGGEYRMQFSSGPGAREVTIVSEGRDPSTNEVRAVEVVYKNQMFQAGIMSGGIITWSNHLQVHWGPVVAHKNIVIDSNAAQEYSPRKFSKQVVSCSNKGNERDTNGLDPPNTDNAEWWSDYDVPEMPILDFAALRASAQTTSTLNVYGCQTTKAAWVPMGNPNKCAGGSGAHNDDFEMSVLHPDFNKNYVWYWDGNVEFTRGQTINESVGIYGTVIIRGNMKIGNNVGDAYPVFAGDVPDDAWKEYEKITKTKGDTAAKNEYPADDGYQTNRDTFDFGNETWTGGPAQAARTDIGFRGFVYIGGNLDIAGSTDYYGAIWVVGNTNKAPGVDTSLVFFDENLENIPTLNVVLKRESWKEIPPDKGTAWP